MKTAPLPKNESERLSALLEYEVLDTEEDPLFDNITHVAALLCHTSISLISLVDRHRLWFKSHHGLQTKEMERDISFCGHAINQNNVFIVEDASANENFFDNPLVTGEPFIRFYAGTPLITPQGEVIGTLCTIDRKPHKLNAQQINLLETLSRQIILILENKKKNSELKKQNERFQLNFLSEIKERKKVEERFRMVVETAPNAMVMVDQNRSLSLINAQAEKLFGYKRAELIGKSLEILIPERFRSQHPEHVKKFFMEPSIRAMGAGRDLFGLHKNGSEIPIEIGLNPLKIENETFVLASIINITERKKAEIALKITNEELMRSNRDLEQFAYVASHDLQEPLRKIISFSSILNQEMSGKLEGDCERYLQFMSDAAVRMKELIQDLLDFARSGQRELVKEKVDLNQVIQTVLENLDISIKDNGAQITTEKLPVAYCAKGFMTQVFQNLIGNAIKFKRPDVNPKVHVKAEKKGNHLIFSIEDNGIGIDKEFVEKVFEIFQRLHRRGQYPGTGIGLAICKKIIERHGGQIWLESEPDKGSTFYFNLPDEDPTAAVR